MILRSMLNQLETDTKISSGPFPSVVLRQAMIALSCSKIRTERLEVIYVSNSMCSASRLKCRPR